MIPVSGSIDAVSSDQIAKLEQLRIRIAAFCPLANLFELIPSH